MPTVMVFGSPPPITPPDAKVSATGVALGAVLLEAGVGPPAGAVDVDGATPTGSGDIEVKWLPYPSAEGATGHRLINRLARGSVSIRVY